VQNKHTHKHVRTCIYKHIVRMHTYVRGLGVAGVALNINIGLYLLSRGYFKQDLQLHKTWQSAIWQYNNCIC